MDKVKEGGERRRSWQ